eukprot:754149-Hanusia_phi.AAC.4
MSHRTGDFSRVLSRRATTTSGRTSWRRWEMVLFREAARVTGDQGRFLHFLKHPEEHEEEWKEEYTRYRAFSDDMGECGMMLRGRVKSDLTAIEELGRIRHYEDISLCVIQVPEPIHYYALFSISKGFDVVLSGYNRNRHEIEQKYTQVTSQDRFTFVTLIPSSSTFQVGRLSQG